MDANRQALLDRFARRLRAARRRAGLSQKALAARAHISRPFLVYMEGAKREPSIVTVVALAKALGVPVTALLG